MIELNVEMKYKEICKALNWKETTGEARQKQIRAVEESFEWYHPMNDKTHKEKKSYIFTRKIKNPVLEDMRKNNIVTNRYTGGKPNEFSEEEFIFLLKRLMLNGEIRNRYHDRGYDALGASERSDDKKVYVSNSLLYQEFGFSPYVMFNTINWNDKETKVRNIFQDICIGAVMSKTLTRICKQQGTKRNSLNKGCLYKKSKDSKHLIDGDEYTEEFRDLREHFAKREFKDFIDCVRKGKYQDLIKEIQSYLLDKYNIHEIKMYNVLFFNKSFIKDFHADPKKTEEYQKHFSDIVMKSIENSITKRIENKDPEKYKKANLNTWDKKLLKNYLEQLQGKTCEVIDGERELDKDEELEKLIEEDWTVILGDLDEDEEKEFEDFFEKFQNCGKENKTA